MADTRDGTRTFNFTNQYGEQWTLSVHVNSEIGKLRGDELDGNVLTIRDDRLPADLILGSDEVAWLNECWQTALGRPLKLTPVQPLAELLTKLTAAGAPQAADR
jgi:hypothetical protein